VNEDRALEATFRNNRPDGPENSGLGLVRSTGQVMWLDWDQTVTGIASQPFRLGKGSGS